MVESSTKGGKKGVGKKGVVKKEKKKVQPLRNANQNLQDDENNNIKTFREKIVEDGLGYSCRFCEFASGNRILAKTHAAYCGQIQHSRRKRSITYSCVRCSETFTSKTYLDKHFKEIHATSSYDCRICGYKTGTRNNFVRHLRIHDGSHCPSFKCDFCEFNAKDNWHLEKHLLSNFKDTNCRSLNGPLCTFCAMDVAVSVAEFQFLMSVPVFTRCPFLKLTMLNL